MEAMKVILSIVERGQGAAMQRLYRQRHLPIHLQCAGRGTATSEIMDILGLGSSEKDVLISFAAASAAKQGERLPEAWKQAAEALPLPEADRMAVAALGEDLHGDEETICKAISLVTYQLAKALEESFRRKPEEDKRTAALCLSGAALLVILLL